MVISTSSLTPPPEYDIHTNIFDQYPEHYGTSEADRCVNIIVKDAHDKKGPGMMFEVKYLNSFVDAFTCFKEACCQTCRAADEIRFKTNNTRIDPGDTPKRHNSTTEIQAWSNVPGLQCKTCKARGYPKTNGVIKPNPSNTLNINQGSTKAETITLLLQDETKFELSVKMMSTVSFDYLMDTYSNEARRDRQQLRFIFDGEPLARTETPKELGMINNDVVQVFIEQIGG